MNIPKDQEQGTSAGTDAEDPGHIAAFLSPRQELELAGACWDMLELGTEA